jgi:hypothetical protein
MPERPELAADTRRNELFDELIHAGGELHYRLPYPRWQLLARAVEAHDVLLHGSNRLGVTRFEPREQTSYEGLLTTAVFATPDPIWPIYFATLDKGRGDSFWNACLLPEESGLERTRYFFSVGKAVETAWVEGAVYLLPAATFRPSDAPAEWVSAEAVEPVGSLRVSRADFPFADRVFRHRLGDPLWRNAARLAWSGWRPQRSRLRRRP